MGGGGPWIKLASTVVAMGVQAFLLMSPGCIMLGLRLSPCLSLLLVTMGLGCTLERADDGGSLDRSPTGHHVTGARGTVHTGS